MLFGPIFSLLTVIGLVAIFIWMIQLFIRLMRLARGIERHRVERLHATRITVLTLGRRSASEPP
jgi:hypothetical protein